MAKRALGLALIVGSISLWVVDRFSQIISTFLGKLYCKDEYMKPVDGITGDPSCGFNADLYLTLSLFILFLIGVALFMLSKNKK